MMQSVRVREAETYLDSEQREKRWRTEEAGSPDEDYKIKPWDAPIPLAREAHYQRNAGFGPSERPISVEDAMKLLVEVAVVKDLRVAYKHSRRGAILAGAAAFAGGMLGGPPGIFIGAAVGGFIGWMTSQSFKSVPQILMELPAAEKQKLRDQVKAVVKNLNWTDVRHLIRLVMTNTDLLERVLGLLTNYLAKKLKAKIKYAK